MGYQHYPFRKLEMGEWFFIGNMKDEDLVRLRRAAAMFAYRNNRRLMDEGLEPEWRFRVRRGSHEGVVGAWCQRIEASGGSMSHPVDFTTPSSDEMASSSKPTWPVDEAHFHGSVSFLLDGALGSRELRNNAESLERCVRNYEKRTDTRFEITHRLTEDGLQKTIRRIDHLPGYDPESPHAPE